MMAYARVLVHLDTMGGLQEHIILQWRTFSRHQILYYEGVPFRCKRCHKVAHILKDFPLNGKERAGDKDNATPHKSSHDQGNPPSVEEVVNHMVQAAAEKVPSKGDRKKCGKVAYGPPSPPLTRARAAVEATFSIGMSESSSSSSFTTVSSYCIA